MRRLLLLPIFIALPAAAAPSPHEWAVAYQNVDARGARAVFNVWNPYVEQPGEFSLAQLWLIAGTPQGQQTLEAAIGGPRSCTSTDGGPQCEIALEFARADNGDWWLKVDGVPVGYYPAARFDPAGLGRNAVTIEAGGEIINQSAGGLHTTTSMGSGRAPSDGYGHAAYVRAIQYAAMSGAYHNATSLTTTTPGNYQTAWIDGMFFFGGPGRVQSATTLRAVSTSSATVAAPSTLTVAFTIDATLDDDVIVGAALANLGLMPDDRRVALKSGSNAAVRSFAVPANLAAGTYDLTATVWRDRNRNGVIDNTDPILGRITYPGAITVAPARRRASR